MEKSKHTPGPWKIDGGRNKENDCFIWEDIGTATEFPGHAIAKVCGWWPNVQANGRLIAAAPEMLDLLKSAVVYMEGCTLEYGGEDGLKLLERSHAILDKVEGE